jgi:hypothetical protein
MLHGHMNVNFIYMLLLAGQTGEAWEGSNKVKFCAGQTGEAWEGSNKVKFCAGQTGEAWEGSNKVTFCRKSEDFRTRMVLSSSLFSSLKAEVPRTGSGTVYRYSHIDSLGCGPNVL